MKKHLLLIALYVLSISAYSQNLQWAKKFGVNGYDQGQALTIDASANVYTVGIFGGTVDFDPGTAVFNLTVSPYGIFILKLDALGNFVWAKSITGGYSNGNSIKVDALGNVIITGQFNGTLDFDPGAATFNLTSAGFADIFILKLDASGNFVWAKNMGGTNEDQGLSSSLDAAGNVYTTGYFRGTADFNPGAGVNELTSAGFSDIFVSKLDAAGNFVWVKSIGTFNFDQGNEIVVDPLGNVLITGSFSETMDFDPGAAIFNMTAEGNSAIYIFKLDAAGNFVWAKKMSGAANTYGASVSIFIDAIGNIYTTGYFMGTVDFDPGAGVANLVTQLQDADIFVSKLDALGNYVWAKSMGGLAGSTEAGMRIAVDIGGNVYTTGFFTGTSDFDPGAGVYNLIATSSDHDVFVSKLDVNGNFIWAGKWGGTLEDQPYGIAVDAAQNIYTTGYFEGTVDFDPGTATFNLTSIGQDVFISKLGLTALPLSLLSFDVSQKQNDAYLSWKTATESNTDKFEIERSTDGILFKKTGELKASGNSTTSKNYHYTDKNARQYFSNQTLYYRLKQLDLDGRFTYSPTQSLKFDKSAVSIHVYPNPTRDVITIQVSLSEVGSTFNITDEAGRKIRNGTLNNRTTSVDIQNLNVGVYFLHVAGLSKETIKVVKR